MSAEDNPKLITVTWPVLVPPLCLELAHGTRVCAVRVDSAEVLRKTVRAGALTASCMGLCGGKLYGFVWARLNVFGWAELEPQMCMRQWVGRHA